MALLLAMTGCTMEEQAAPASAGDGEITFRIQREQGCLTRAAIADGGSITFQEGDVISVFDGDGNNCKFTQSGDIGSDGTATFKGDVNMVASSYLVLYPYMPEVNTADGLVGTIGADDVRRPVFIPDQQKAVEDSFDPQAFISVAKSVKESDYVHSITLHNACALVKFNITEESGDFTFEKAVLETVTSGLLAGGIRVHPDGTREWAGPGSLSVTLTGSMQSGHSYYFCTDARDVKGLRLSLYRNASDTTPLIVKESAPDKVITLVRNHVLDLGTMEMEKTNDWYGDGSAGNPYQIHTLSDLKLLMQRLSNQDDPSYRGLNYIMTGDIDCGGEALIEDGKRVEFCGVFEGNHHVISNYLPSGFSEKIYPSQEYSLLRTYHGIFHKVYRATFRNLTLKPASPILKQFDSSNMFSPFIALVEDAASPTNIEGCRIEGNVELKYSIYGSGYLYFGGFVAVNYSDALNFTKCTNSADYSFSENVFEGWDEEMHYYEYRVWDDVRYDIGGFVGDMYCADKNSTTNFDRCRNNGDIKFVMDVSGGHVHCGGFVGNGNWGFIYASTFSFTNCVNSGDIEAGINSDNENYAAGFIGFNEIDGSSHYGGSSPEKHLAVPRMYNCLNKGDITAGGNGAHAAGIAYYAKHGGTDDSLQFALCINTGEISATGTGSTKAAISSGHGTCRWCWWLEADKDNPVLQCTTSGIADHCYCYPTINADTPNNRRIGSDGHGGSDIVLDLTNSQWSNALWIANTVEWTGGTGDGSLDLNF